MYVNRWYIGCCTLLYYVTNGNYICATIVLTFHEGNRCLFWLEIWWVWKMSRELLLLCCAFGLFVSARAVPRQFKSCIRNAIWALRLRPRVGERLLFVAKALIITIQWGVQVRWKEDERDSWYSLLCSVLLSILCCRAYRMAVRTPLARYYAINAVCS